MKFTPRGRELIESALVWLAEGVSPVPAMPKSKEVRLRWRRFEEVPPTKNQIYGWFGHGLNNLAVVCGTGGLLVLDFDDYQAYRAWRGRAGGFARSYTELTGRGVHVFFKVDQPVNKRFPGGVEALGLGHLCMVAPSIHPEGRIYYPLGNPCVAIQKVQAGELFSLLSESSSSTTLREVYPVKAVKSVSGLAVIGGDVVTRLKACFPLFDYAMSLTELETTREGGRWWRGKCPLHSDKNPSFWVDTLNNLWGCYSPTCKGSRGGDVLNLYALANNITVNEAIRRLARQVL